jgi:peroxiredoxin family protein
MKIDTQTADVAALAAQIEALKQRVAELERAPAQDIEDQLTMIVFSDDLDRAIAAFIMAAGAAAMGLNVSMFFSFWGLSIIKKQAVYANKNIWERGFALMLPENSRNLGLSHMNYFGAGSKIMRKLMDEQGMTSLETLIAEARNAGVRFVACGMSKELLGITDDEIIDGVELGGVATFLGDAARAKTSFFI